MASPTPFVDPWRQRLRESWAGQSADLAGYQSEDQVDSLVTTSCARSFEVGTGASIYTNSLLPAISQAQHEVIFVTCFWAPSSTLTALKDTLEQLARARSQLIAEGGPDGALDPLRIRICFSSRSLFQKLFHTSSEDGYTYPPDTWPTLLNLPSQDILEAAAIDLRVKTLFFVPFSIMHPKFLIVDRQRAWFPSCNVSWEPWFEGCLEVTGDIVTRLLGFYQRVWDRNLDLTSPPGPESQPRLPQARQGKLNPLGLTSIQSPARRFSSLGDEMTPTILLPSAHHRNPRFSILPWASNPQPPATPLNVALMRLLEMAQHSIYMYTPNLSCGAVIDSIIEALGRGVHVTVVTSKSLMWLEQLVTSGTTSYFTIRSLIRRYRKMLQAEDGRVAAHGNGEAAGFESTGNLEAAVPRLGRLRITYFRGDPDNVRGRVLEEPVNSHLKLTIVDGQYTVLGSGNMDRPSWFTSQELGILLFSPNVARTVAETASAALTGREDVVFDSSSA